MRMPYASALFADKMKRAAFILSHCLRPTSPRLVNPLGVRMGQCSYCGFCERFACGNYSKASAQTTILPVLDQKPNFEARTEVRC